MGRVLPLVVVLALWLSACGTASPPQAPLYNYPDKMKASFMDACTSAVGHRWSLDQSQTACRCALLKIEDRIPASDVAQIGKPNARADITASASEAVKACSPK